MVTLFLPIKGPQIAYANFELHFHIRHFYSLHAGLHAFHVQYIQRDTIRENVHTNLITIMSTAAQVPQQHVMAR